MSTTTRLAIGVFVTASAWGQMFDLGAVPRAEEAGGAIVSKPLPFSDPQGAAFVPTPAPTPARTISVDQLRHPLSRKAVKLIEKAGNFASMGRHDRAIEQLQLAMKEPSAVPWVQSMLGVEYLKTNQVPAAIAELEEAVKELPRNVPDHSNLGYALFLTGDFDRAEAEAREALDLDHNNEKTKRVLGQILSARRPKTDSQP